MLNKEEMILINKIVKRGFPLMKDHYISILDMTMDIDAANNDIPLKLNDLLIADDLNFYHDIMGIYNNINRNTKKIDNCFLPRYAK